MSLSSYIHPFLRTGDWWDLATPSRIFDQNFGMGVFNDPFFTQGLDYYRPRHVMPATGAGDQQQQLQEQGMSEVVNNDEKFSVKLDVSHFTPEEVKVKVLDNQLIIEAKHEEKVDPHGFVSRSFKRRYILPKNVDMQAITSNLTANGVLAINAPKTQTDKPNERAIPINVANKPAVEQKK